MPAVTIDLDVQLENLVGLKIDLDEHYWSVAEQAEPSVRFALGLALSQLTARIGGLEEVVRHHGGGEVTIVGLTLEESRALGRALGLLDGELLVEVGAPPARLWTMVRGLLAAADDLLLATARGQRASDVHHDHGPRPGVVLPLIRSSR
jgi:hypothetical protein